MENKMNILMADRGLISFRYMKNIFILLFLFTTCFVNAQKIVTGLVQDASSGKPVNAATISVIGKKVTATTDEKGRFTLNDLSSEDVIVVEAYDYNKREVSLRGRESLVISLFSDVFNDYFKKLNGITGSIENSSLISSAKSIDIINKSSAISADELMQTTLGGDVRAINRSGTTGIGSSLFIRGLNSLNANAQPLFVVDGVIWNNMYDVESVHRGFFSNTLDNIDVNDIESITVLKDGLSIYGSKAANGVILIKTKRAVSEVTKISLNVMSGYTMTPGSVPMMKGEDFRVYANDLYNSAGMSGTDVANLGFLQNNPSDVIYNTYHNNTDWNDEVYRLGKTNSYMINVNGGDDKAFYYFSLGYTSNKGVIKGSDLTRVNSRFNADLKLLPQLDLGLNIGFSRNERTMQDDGIDFYSSPTWLSKIKSPFMSPYNFTSTGRLTTDYADADIFGTGNPSAVLENSLNNMKNYSFNISLNPVYRIAQGLTLSSQFDYNLYKAIERRFVPMTGTAPRLIEDFGISLNEINSQVMRNTSLFDETRLVYEKNFNQHNHLKTLLGFRYIYNFYESDYAEEHNTGSDNNTIITGDYSFLQVNGINNETRSLSDYLQAEYNFDNRYYLSAAVAIDGSSRFGNETEGGLHLFNRSWGAFPSINAAWLVSSEDFMKPLGFVNYLKLRAGYGLTGNDGIKDYESMAYFSYVRFMSVANGLVISNLGNNKLQWETSGKANLGIDLGMFNERVNLTFDLYSSLTKDLLVLKDAPIISGLGKYWSNGGSMSNKGFELSADFRALNLKDLKWELGISAGHYKNRIESLDNGQYTTSVYEGEVLSAVGQPAGVFYGFKTKGVFSTIDEASQAYTDASGGKSFLKIVNVDGSYSNFTAGDIYFDDYDKNGVIDDNDRQVIGDPNPDFYGNIFSKITVNKISLNTVLTYSLGNDVYNYSRSQLEAGKDFSNQTTVMLNRWTGENQITNQPKAVYGDPMGNSRFSDRWIEDGSYLRLKSVTLSYELPIKSNYIQGLEFWLSANNLLTLTRYLGLDPEFSAGNSVYYQGVDAGLVPSTRSYNIGFKLNL
jgi:TonB-linked SusC/RagA family outer membrane protein